MHVRVYAMIIFSCLVVCTALAQGYTSGSIFAHNDYAQENSFYGAYSYRVGYIEADVFLKDGELMVAHLANEIQKDRTLENLYLIPLKGEMVKNMGWAYADSTLRLTLMIDLKTAGISTLQKLVPQLNNYPELISCRNFEIVISGNVPPADQWNAFPTFIHFDARPGINYTTEQLKRISLISISFSSVSLWDGKSDLPKQDQERLEKLIRSVHTFNKKIRFWGAPDFENGWTALKKLKVDVIGTDNVFNLFEFLEH